MIQFSEAKRQVSVLAVMERCGVNMSHYNTRGDVTQGPCPLKGHGDVDVKYRNREQFKIDTKDRGYQMFRCFSGDCGYKGGDSVTMAKALLGLDNGHVSRWFEEQFPDRLKPSIGRSASSRPKAAAVVETTTAKPEQPVNKEETAKERPEAQLDSQPETEAPADAGEADSKPEPIKEKDDPPAKPKATKAKATKLKPLRFHLKLDGSVPYLLNDRQLTPATIEYFGIGLCNKGMMKDRIAIPIWLPGQEPDEKPVAYCGRKINDDDDGPRYLLPDGFPRNDVVYNLGAALRDSKDDDPLVITEGAFKTMWIYQEVGIPNVVATFGSSLGDGQAQRLIDSGRPLVLLWDGGTHQKAAIACQQLYRQAHVIMVCLDDGVDPDDLSGEELRELLAFIL